MLIEITAKRPDATLVGTRDGLPYHFIPGDALWPIAQEIARRLGDALPLEAPLPPLTPEPQPPMTLAELQAQMAMLQAQMAALTATQADADA